MNVNDLDPWNCNFGPLEVSLEVIKSKYRITMLDTINHCPGGSRTELINADGDRGNARTKYLAIEDLIKFHLAEDRKDREGERSRIYLTQSGRDVLNLLNWISKSLVL